MRDYEAQKCSAQAKTIVEANTPKVPSNLKRLATALRSIEADLALLDARLHTVKEEGPLGSEKCEAAPPRSDPSHGKVSSVLEELIGDANSIDRAIQRILSRLEV